MNAIGNFITSTLIHKIPSFLADVGLITPHLVNTPRETIVSVATRGTCPEHVLYFDGFRVIINEHEGQWAYDNLKAKLMVSDFAIDTLTARLHYLVSSFQRSAFYKQAVRWNAVIINFASKYREAILATPLLKERMSALEVRVCVSIMDALDSRSPDRYPPLIFFSPQNIGGLGMVSLLGTDLSKSMWTSSKLSHVPGIIDYLRTWQQEFILEKDNRPKFKAKLAAAVSTNSRLEPQDISDISGTGLPRFDIHFFSDRSFATLVSNPHFCKYYSQYTGAQRSLSSLWTVAQVDGHLSDLADYHEKVIESLGGIEEILKNSIFPATGIDSYKELNFSFASNTTFSSRKMTKAMKLGASAVPNRAFALWWSPTINRSRVYVGYQTQVDLTGVRMWGKLPTLKISFVNLFNGHLWQKIHESLVLDLCKALETHASRFNISKISKETIHPRKSYQLNHSAADITLYCANISGWEIGDAYTASCWLDFQITWGSIDDDPSAMAKSFYLKMLKTNSYVNDIGAVIMFDLVKLDFGIYGKLPTGLFETLNEIIRGVSNSNVSIFALKDRIKKSLHIESTSLQANTINISNFGSLFSTAQRTLLVDPSKTYRYYIDQKSQKSKPRNGFMMLLTPSNGELLVPIIHSTTWTGQKRKGELARFKAAEELSGILRVIDTSLLPRRLLVADKSYSSAISVQLLEYPQISVQDYNLNVQLHQILDHSPYLKSLVNDAPSHVVKFMNLYDDWLIKPNSVERISAYTAFMRIALILRAFELDTDKTRDLIQLPESSLWPKLDFKEWENLEVKLKNVVVETYCANNNIPDARLLSSSDVRTIILIGEVDSTITEEIIRQSNVQSVSTVNRLGQQIVVKTSSVYETGQFLQEVESVRLQQQTEEALNRVVNRLVITSYNTPNYIANDMLNNIISTASLNRITVALLAVHNNNIIAIAMPPQISLHSRHFAGCGISFDLSSETFTKTGSLETISAGFDNTYRFNSLLVMCDSTLANGILKEHFDEIMAFESIFRINIDQGTSIELNEDKYLAIGEVESFIICPSKGIWRLSLPTDDPVIHSTTLSLRPGMPLTYYDEFHRISDFK